MNAPDLSADFLGLALVALLLGVKHGFDADHLAAIDAMTRFNALERPRLARRTGLLFLLGHGGVVVGVALTASALAGDWQAPAWLAAFGAWVSISVLLLLGGLNLLAPWRTPADRPVRLAAWRGALFSWLLTAGSPWLVMAVGTLFALSFDTVSQAALMAVTATRFGGWAPLGTLLLSGLFVLGMLVTDGLNSVWITGLLRRSGAAALVASRVMAWAVAGVSLATAALGIAAQLLPAVGSWLDGQRLGIGVASVASVAILAGVFASFLLGLGLAARNQRAGKVTLRNRRNTVA